MRLSPREFKGMQSAFRRFLQRNIEYPKFKRLGLTQENQSILEIGCGSGYGAELLQSLEPKKYVGVDLMPEQIELAHKRNLPKCEFLVRDAAELSEFNDETWDTVVIFGVLHHIQAWRSVMDEIFRLLKSGGSLFIEEPSFDVLRFWDRLFKWGHPNTLYLKDFEEYAESIGLTIERKSRLFVGFFAYRIVKAGNHRDRELS